MTLAEQFWPQFRAALKASGVSQRRLALLAGLDPSHINHLFHRRRQPSLDVIDSIAKVLGCTATLTLSAAKRKDRTP